MASAEQARAAELRAAWEESWLWASTTRVSSLAHVREEAARRYPDPATPRVLRAPDGVEWRYLPDESGFGGSFEVRDPGSKWSDTGDALYAKIVMLSTLMDLPFVRDGKPCATAAGPEADA